MASKVIYEKRWENDGNNSVRNNSLQRSRRTQRAHERQLRIVWRKRETNRERKTEERMDKFLIRGGKALHGTVAISGAKNSALPAMAAALLTSEKVTLHNIPKVRDLITMSKLLAFMHARVSVTEIPASDYEIEAPT